MYKEEFTFTAFLKSVVRVYYKPKALIETKLSTVSLQILKTGDLVKVSSLLTSGYTFLNVENTPKNIKIPGIITIKHGQFTQAIAIIIPIIINPD